MSLLIVFSDFVTLSPHLPYSITYEFSVLIPFHFTSPLPLHRFPFRDYEFARRVLFPVETTFQDPVPWLPSFCQRHAYLSISIAILHSVTDYINSGIYYQEELYADQRARVGGAEFGYDHDS